MEVKEKLWENVHFKPPNMEEFSKKINSLKEENRIYSENVRRNWKISDKTLLK